MATAEPSPTSIAASIAANTAVARLNAEGRRRRMDAANQARLQAYLDAVEDAVETAETLTEEERIAAARNLMAADMARLSLLGVEARKRKKRERELAKAS